MHWKRWITALVLIPPLVLLILKGSPGVFTAGICIVGLLCLWEYYLVAFHGHAPPVPLLFAVWGYLFSVVVMVAAHAQNFQAMVLSLTLCLIGTAIMSIFRFKTTVDAPIIAVKQVFGVFYISFLISFLILIRQSSDGPMWVLFFFWVIAWGDTCALYIGSYLGRHKLCPAVSPKKTIEGAVGGLMGNLIFGWVFKILFFSSMNPVTCTVFSLGVGVIGQFGDLFESEFKRAAGVKDSSCLLPGHGGVLDRLDAILLSAPVAYLLKEYVLP